MLSSGGLNYYVYCFGFRAHKPKIYNNNRISVEIKWEVVTLY